MMESPFFGVWYNYRLQQAKISVMYSNPSHSSISLSATDDKVLNFPAPSSKNYALLKTNMPALTEFTVCAWAQSNDKDSKGYFFSLATGKGDAANQIALSALNSLNVAVKSSFQQTSVQSSKDLENLSFGFKV
jgi:hypothetical protein